MGVRIDGRAEAAAAGCYDQAAHREDADEGYHAVDNLEDWEGVIYYVEIYFESALGWWLNHPGKYINLVNLFPQIKLHDWSHMVFPFMHFMVIMMAVIIMLFVAVNRGVLRIRILVQVVIAENRLSIIVDCHDNVDFFRVLHWLVTF